MKFLKTLVLFVVVLFAIVLIGGSIILVFKHGGPLLFVLIAPLMIGFTLLNEISIYLKGGV